MEARACGHVCSSRLTVVCHYLPKQSTSNLPHFENCGNSVPSIGLLSFFVFFFVFDFLIFVFRSFPFLSLSPETQHLKYAWVLVLGRNSLCGNFMSVKGYGPQACKVRHFRTAMTARPTWVQIVLASNSSFKAQVSSQAFWMASWLEGKPSANVHSLQSHFPHVLGSIRLMMCLIHEHGTLGSTLCPYG